MKLRLAWEQKYRGPQMVAALFLSKPRTEPPTRSQFKSQVGSHFIHNFSVRQPSLFDFCTRHFAISKKRFEGWRYMIVTRWKIGANVGRCDHGRSDATFREKKHCCFFGVDKMHEVIWCRSSGYTECSQRSLIVTNEGRYSSVQEQHEVALWDYCFSLAFVS